MEWTDVKEAFLDVIKTTYYNTVHADNEDNVLILLEASKLAKKQHMKARQEKKVDGADVMFREGGKPQNLPHKQQKTVCGADVM